MSTRNRAAAMPFDEPREIPIGAKLAHLRSAAAYSPPPSRVEVVETHMSWVFLTDLHAWKLKKPVRRAFLDFSTLAARKANCEAEIRLNRRLAPEVYLAVVPLAVGGDGTLVLGGAGTPVEWLVQMRRLPRDRMLDAAIARGTVTEADVARVAAVLAAFYRSLAPLSLAAEALRERLAGDVEASGRVLSDPVYGLPPAEVTEVSAALVRFVDTHVDLLAARIAAGRIVEGHGDLRPEHVCLLDPPAIIDCIEFNRDFRRLDLADDLALLALECERLGNAGLGAQLFATCCAALGDRVPEALFHFYVAARALLRAKLAAWHLADVPPEEHHRWIGRAAAYLDLAARHTGRLA